MSFARWFVAAVTAILLTGCGTLEENAWTSGVAPKVAMEISQAIRASTPVKTIYQYSRDEEDGSIMVSTDKGIYSARRVNGKWKFNKEIIVT